HLGVGKEPGAGWHNYEDFRWNDEFVAFLKALRQQSPDGVDLVLNGDTFELWQSTEPDCKPVESNKNVGCSENEAADRLERVLSAHRDSIDALRAFAEESGNHVILVPGNHDAALLFPSVRDLLAEVAGPKVDVRMEGFWLTEDHRILFEHGHQFDEVNEMK